MEMYHILAADFEKARYDITSTLNSWIDLFSDGPSAPPHQVEVIANMLDEWTKTFTMLSEALPGYVAIPDLFVKFRDVKMSIIEAAEFYRATGNVGPTTAYRLKEILTRLRKISLLYEI